MFEIGFTPTRTSKSIALMLLHSSVSLDSTSQRIHILRGKGAFYTLESLLFYMTKGRQLAAGAYMQEASHKQLQSVSFIDRKDLLDFLQGVTETSDYIQITVPTLPTLLQAAVPSSEEVLSQTKRKRTEGEPGAP
eukprot:5308357-Pyramimonas_sp.AAC.1